MLANIYTGSLGSLIHPLVILIGFSYWFLVIIKRLNGLEIVLRRIERIYMHLQRQKDSNSIGERQISE